LWTPSSFFKAFGINRVRLIESFVIRKDDGLGGVKLRICANARASGTNPQCTHAEWKI
jgi:hypothetical protein